MSRFVVLSKTFEISPSHPLQYQIYFTLSLLAEFLRHCPQALLPFTAPALHYIFDLECQTLPKS